MFNWETNPNEVGSWVSKITKNNKVFHLTVGHTFIKIESTAESVVIDTSSIEEAEKIALRLINMFSER